MSALDRQVTVASIASAVAAGIGWAFFVAAGSSLSLALAIFFHLASAGLTAALVPPRRRALALALGLAVPVIGPLAAALTTLVRGTGGAELIHDPHARARKLDGSEIARRLTGSLPACEALASADVDARRQALAKLTTRAAADDIAILRWALTQRSGDAAVEIALAFEEVSARFEQRASAARSAVKAAPSYASLATLFRILCEGITTGLVDAPLVGRIAAEARRHHDRALELDAERGHELLVHRARLELAVRRPALVLEMLAGQDIDNDHELYELYREAAYAARRFDLAPAFAPRRTAVARA